MKWPTYSYTKIKINHEDFGYGKRKAEQAASGGLSDETECPKNLEFR